MSARDRTDWMSLDGLKAHFTMHALQADLLDAGLERRGTEGPAFILLHTGAALRPDGAEARQEILEAIEDKIRIHEEEAQVSLAMADRWRDIQQRIEAMTDDDPWKNPLWEREILNSLKSELRSFGTGASITPRHGDRLFGHKFRRGFTYRDVVCVHEGRYSAFKVDQEPMGMMHSLPEEWRSLFPDLEFKRTVFRWMVFPKDLSGETTIAYLQFGDMAGRLAGNGHTRRYDHEQDQWIERESVESWVS